MSQARTVAMAASTSVNVCDLHVGRDLGYISDQGSERRWGSLLPPHPDDHQPLGTRSAGPLGKAPYPSRLACVEPARSYICKVDTVETGEMP